MAPTRVPFPPLPSCTSRISDLKSITHCTETGKTYTSTIVRITTRVIASFIDEPALAVPLELVQMVSLDDIDKISEESLM